MKRLGIVTVMVAALFAAFGASSALAGKKLVARTKAGVIAPGSKIKGFSSNLIFETAAGNLECEENELLGTIDTNEASKIKGTITEEHSKGDYLGMPGACKTSATGPVIIVSSHLPWSVEFKNNGTGKVKGKKVTFDSEFLALEGPNNHCTFEASTVAFTYNVGKENAPEPVTEQTTKQKFKHAKKAPNQTTLCPAEGELSGTFSVTAGPGFSEVAESELRTK